MTEYLVIISFLEMPESKVTQQIPVLSKSSEKKRQKVNLVSPSENSLCVKEQKIQMLF